LVIFFKSKSWEHMILCRMGVNAHAKSWLCSTFGK
jgi:hypothetical protein